MPSPTSDEDRDMTTPDLGTIEKVDLHEAWPKEASDFTPWLEEHISALGDALRMDLEFQSREAPVGPFSLDILARDVGRDRPVVIENQLTATDHDHLGKLLTYASGYDASVVVWLAQDIREEHRQALDWLNQRTGENTEFFGIVIELLKFDGSRPAVNFKLVAFPNDWTSTRIKDSAGQPSPRMEAYRSYFQRLIDDLREKHKFTGARKAQPQSWYAFSSGFSGITYGSSFAQGGQARVNLYIDHEKEWNKNLFDELQHRKESLEPELQESLEWERLDNARASRIAVYRDGSIDDPIDSLEEIKDWSIDRLLSFKRVFGPMLADLAK